MVMVRVLEPGDPVTLLRKHHQQVHLGGDVGVVRGTRAPGNKNEQRCSL